MVACIYFFPGVKFAPSTKEFTVAIPGKGNAVFDMEKKVTNAHKTCYDIISSRLLKCSSLDKFSLPYRNTCNLIHSTTVCHVEL